MMTVYLAGGMQGLSYAKAAGWRLRAAKLLDDDVLDPMRRDYREKLNGTFLQAAEIVEADLQDIRDSDVLLAYCEKPSWGTAMEMWYADAKAGVPVVAIVPEGTPSPWLVYITVSLFHTLEDACQFINDGMEVST